MVRLGLRSSIWLTTWQKWSVSVREILLLKTQPDQSFPKSGRWGPDMSSFKINKFKTSTCISSASLSAVLYNKWLTSAPLQQDIYTNLSYTWFDEHTSHWAVIAVTLGKPEKRVFWLNVRQEIVEGRQSYNQLSVTFAVSNMVKEVLINISSMLWLSMWCKEVACSDEPTENYHLNLQLPSTNFTFTDQACNFTVLISL